MRVSIWRTTWFRVAIGTLISFFFLYLAVKDVPLAEVIRALAGANYAWVLLAVIMMLVQSWLRAVRWMLLFSPLNRGLQVRQLFAIILVSQMLNIVAPWRLGDLARIYLAGEIENRSKVQTLATLATEKVFDTLMLLMLLLGIPLFVTLPAQFEESRAGLIVVSFLLFAVLIVLTFAGERILYGLKRIPLPWFSRLLDKHGTTALSSLDVFKRWDLHLELQGLSLLVWFIGVVVNWLALLALNLPLPLVTSFLLLAVLQVGGFVPSSPGKVGVFQALCIFTLALFGVDKSLGLTYGILLYFIAYGTPVVIGVLIVWWGGMSLRSLKGARIEAESSQ